MGSLNYADDTKVLALQAADNLAYEVGKHLLNSRYDAKRVERKAMTRLKENTVVIYVFDKPSLEMVVKENLQYASFSFAAGKDATMPTDEGALYF